MSDDLRGSLFMVASMVGFAAEDALFKAAVASASPGAATLIFGLLGLAGFAALTAAARQRLFPAAFLAPRLLCRSAFEIAGRLFFALSLAYAPLATTSAILQAAPLVVTLGAALLLGERVGPARWAAMGAGFAGVLLILRPGGAGFEPTLVFAVLATIGFAGRDLATRTSPPEISARQLGVLGFLVVSAAGGLITLGEARTALPDARALLLLLGTAAAGIAAYWLITRAMRTGDVSVVAPFRYARLLVALAVAAAVFGERPDAATWAGAALIVGSGLFTLLRAGQPRRLRL